MSDQFPPQVPITERYVYLTDCSFPPRVLDSGLLLGDREVHLWLADLQISATDRDRLFKHLSDDEVQRAKRYRFEKDQNAFIASRGILRMLLGAYAGMHPAEIQFSYRDRGKPELANSKSISDLQFNLSHANGMALYAIAHHLTVGVDLEFHRPTADLEQLSKRFFSAQEYAIICALPPEQRQPCFFRLWTCKEAYIKATGDGLMGLSTATLAFDIGQSFKILGLEASTRLKHSWSLVQFQPLTRYTAAMAVASQDYHLRLQKLRFASAELNRPES